VGQKLLIPEPGEVARMAAKKPTKAGPSPAKSPVAEQATLESADPIKSTEVDGAAAAEDNVTPDSAGTAIAELTVAPSASATQGIAESKPPASVLPEQHQKTEPNRQTHVVARGNTIGKLAHLYHLRELSILHANGLRRTDQLRPGQTLVIPTGDDDPIITTSSDDEPAGHAKRSTGKTSRSGLPELSVPGAGPTYYYDPLGPARNTMRPVLVYLHGRGGDAEQDCRKWAPVARRYGWLICPSGPVVHNSGRSWNNSWVSGRHAVMGAIAALRKLYGRRVQLYGNTLIGFSEGAFVAMNVGVREPHTFNRWLILGADTSYWGGSGLEALQEARGRVRRVVLITGGLDQVVDDTRRVAEWLTRAGVQLQIHTPNDLAHEVALDKMPGLYDSALRWLDRGGRTTPAARR
jgi:predicted esterase/LysM repeat protein